MSAFGPLPPSHYLRVARC